MLSVILWLGYVVQLGLAEVVFDKLLPHSKGLGVRQVHLLTALTQLVWCLCPPKSPRVQARLQ